MTKLEKLYSTIQNLKELGLELGEDLIKHMNLFLLQFHLGDSLKNRTPFSERKYGVHRMLTLIYRFQLFFENV